MADSKISALTDGGAPQAGDETVVVRVGANKRVQLGTAAGSATTDFDASGAATSAVSTHVALADPHTQYALESALAAVATSGAKADVGLGSVTNDAQTKAAIVPNTAPTAGQLLVGNAGGTAYAPVSASGDATVASDGTITVSQARGLRETGGPTTLTMGAVADGQVLTRSGSSIVGSSPSAGSGISIGAAVALRAYTPV